MEYNDRIFRMSIPALEEFTCVASNAIKGALCSFGIALDILDDVCIASKEAIYSLRNQVAKADNIQIECTHVDKGFIVEFTSLSAHVREHCNCCDNDLTRGILETLIPKCNILCDERGIFCITFFFPNTEA
ncbi:MAG: hypothetical protein SPL05_05255 [Eubacteriales bacterium]|nr:hypothetical protein [Eubacteriales bacterium]